MTIVTTKDPINAGDARVFSILRKSAISQLNALNAQDLTRLKTIANEEGVDEELLARAFRAELPALRKLSHPDDKACEIFQAYVANEIASDIRHLSRGKWEKTIEELSPETGTLCRRISLLKKPFHHIPPPPLKGALGSIAVAPIEKAEVIADILQKQFEPNTDIQNPRFSSHIQRKVQRFLDSPTCMDLEKTSPSEIQGFIKILKPNKSLGIDLITNRILKNLPAKFIIFIALLFNMLLENFNFPKSSRMAVVIPIFKPNSDNSNTQNYRPISLLSSSSKAYEFVILNRLNQHCLAGNIIIP
ncbi:putative RNA-directed DNA polymerase from transposon X-element [Trichonephila clavipes]|nr:putative RNA-directed DNA polymerase from transposon X-element [Trichonephila clavipes]